MGVRISREQAAELGLAFEVSSGRQESGREASHRGASFEKVLDDVHERYWAHGLAHVYRLPVHTAPMPKAAAEKAGFAWGVARVLARRQHCDFHGAMCVEPFRAIVMEAKASKKLERRLPIVPDDSSRFGIKRAQLASLARYARRSSAVAAIVWRNADDVLVLGPRSVVRADDQPHATFKSIPADWFASCAPALDWLTTALADWAAP